MVRGVHADASQQTLGEICRMRVQNGVSKAAFPYMPGEGHSRQKREWELDRRTLR